MVMIVTPVANAPSAARNRLEVFRDSTHLGLLDGLSINHASMVMIFVAGCEQESFTLQARRLDII